MLSYIVLRYIILCYSMLYYIMLYIVLSYNISYYVILHYTITCMYVCMYVSLSLLYVCMYVCMYIYIYIYIYTQMCVCIHIYIYIYTHVYNSGPETGKGKRVARKADGKLSPFGEFRRSCPGTKCRPFWSRAILSSDLSCLVYLNCSRGVTPLTPTQLEPDHTCERTV